MSNKTVLVSTSQTAEAYKQDGGKRMDRRVGRTGKETPPRFPPLSVSVTVTLRLHFFSDQRFLVTTLSTLGLMTHISSPSAL